MDTIHSLSEIDYANNQNISFLATVISVVNDGDGDKRPFKAILKLEDSGEQTAIYSWKFDLLEKIKHLADTDDVYNFVGQANLYKDVEKQIRIYRQSYGFSYGARVEKLRNHVFRIQSCHNVFKHYTYGYDYTYRSVVYNRGRGLRVRKVQKRNRQNMLFMRDGANIRGYFGNAPNDLQNDGGFRTIRQSFRVSLYGVGRLEFQFPFAFRDIPEYIRRI